MEQRDQDLEQVRADHASLMELLGCVERASELQSLAPLLAEFDRLLARHFALEERDDGLFDSVASRAPRLSVRIDECRTEHGDLLRVAADLRRRAEECLARKAAILEETRAFLHRLADHECRETHLLSDSVYTDLGVGD